VFAPGKPPVKMQPEIFYIFLGELQRDFSLCGENDVDTVCVKQLLDHRPWLVLQYRRRRLLW
jgi:hypothetical protein